MSAAPTAADVLPTEPSGEKVVWAPAGMGPTKELHRRSGREGRVYGSPDTSKNYDSLVISSATISSPLKRTHHRNFVERHVWRFFSEMTFDMLRGVELPCACCLLVGVPILFVYLCVTVAADLATPFLVYVMGTMKGDGYDAHEDVSKMLSPVMAYAPGPKLFLSCCLFLIVFFAPLHFLTRAFTR